MEHDEIVRMMLLDGSDHRTIDAVSVAVKERDELRDAVAWESKRVDQLHLAAGCDAEDKAKLRKERDAAREALAAILLHIDPYEDSLQATIAAFVEQGMG